MSGFSDSRVCVRVCVCLNDEQVGSGNTHKRGKRAAVEQNPTDCSSDPDQQRAIRRKGDVSARACLYLIDASPAATFETWRTALIGKKLEVPGKFWRNWPDKKALYPWLARGWAWFGFSARLLVV